MPLANCWMADISTSRHISAATDGQKNKLVICEGTEKGLGLVLLYGRDLNFSSRQKHFTDLAGFFSFVRLRTDIVSDGLIWSQTALYIGCQFFCSDYFSISRIILLILHANIASAPCIFIQSRPYGKDTH